ncbi:HAD-IA family hydrolase [Rubrobacter marinus]|uniref:HAD-IA family hydrolase n=1 Tax=Rubrobacter marinus TaxID=2653852 RepID=A0A6G8PT98_9ACTN|nr:HAD-IA family hydrolase [Rubrobacter marinus]QIN77427.1 HAD-IA family hydrolase [Rubrobacter marinus]
MAFTGAIFDVDGVLVDSPHEKAWREGLRQLMEGDWSDIREQTSWSPEAFTPQVYQREMSGKPRFKGAQAALEYFGVPDAERRALEYGNRKQEMIVELIEAADFEEYPDALRFVLEVKAAGILIAAASSSKNAGAFLRLVRLDAFAEKEGLGYDFLRPGYTLLDILDGDVSGRDFAQGKPHPEIFLTAAGELSLAPGECFVVEDAVNGVQAAKAGEMTALGVARADDEEALAEAGADLVVTSLDDVSVGALAEGRLERASVR